VPSELRDDHPKMLGKSLDLGLPLVSRPEKAMAKYNRKTLAYLNVAHLGTVYFNESSMFSDTLGGRIYRQSGVLTYLR